MHEETWEALEPQELVFDTGVWNDGKVVIETRGRGALFGAKVRWRGTRYMKQTQPLQILDPAMIKRMAKNKEFIRAKDLGTI